MPDTSASHVTRPLDAAAAALVVLICLSWGFNQVSVKLAIHDIPPLMQGTIRSVGATILVAAWCRWRGMPLFSRDGTLVAGLVTGALFGLEFVLIYQGLAYTTATRAVLFIYLAPFFVVLGTRIVLPADRFGPAQWLGLALSFAGMMVAFGAPTPALDPRQMIGDLMMVAAAAMAWAATTLMIKTSLNRISSEKVMLYQLVVSIPMLAIGALLFGEHVRHFPSALAIGALAYQTIWVVSVTFVLWFALVVRYSANRLSAFSFLTPLFGVAAGHFVLGEPMTPAFAAAVALVALGLVLVNRR
ncbi:MAG TPA: DMT family transporter [Pseudolabrys sp.]|uniref:DMT family transporter n=1 Tax=Pseudolabrys sp. TaxID=1960880 RepID=UPI002DDCCCDF|nr:DMT family transporter [Pseudolabrys sp.]HEV2629816.1 DMT family transporter [Pseudolabrys sp.]